MPRQIEEVLATVSPTDECEIAFFGGSFTGIDRGLMCRLLELAAGYVKRGRVQSIRLSTRPDMIDDEILELLGRYPVRTVELGIQSTSDRVLQASRRGHTAHQAEQACRAVKAAGFDLVGQMMIGLPGSTPEEEVETAELLCRMGVAGVRIYPTVVFYHTPLAEMTAKGNYIPLTVPQAAERSAAVLERFSAAGIPILRIGLCATEELTSPEAVMAGPNHPALGEQVWSRFYYRKIYAVLEGSGLLGQAVVLTVPQREISKAVGQHRCNIERLRRETGTEVKQIYGGADDSITASPWRAN